MKTSDKNIDKKQHAQLLYITQGKTHAEIAEEVGVSERTVFNWVHQYAWDKLRLAAYQAPVSIANSLCEEIVELQQNIALRDAGQRFPTPQESLTMQRMISSLEKMKKYPSLSQNMQVLESFKNYIKPLDKEFSKTLGNYTSRYLSSAAQNAFVPYQLEYGIDAAPPLAPYYDEEEVEINEPSASTWHPDNPINYTIPGIHHARPYMVPLMHICYDQLVEDQQRMAAQTKVMDDYLEEHYGTVDTATEIATSPNHGNDPEMVITKNNTGYTFEEFEKTSVSAAPIPEVSGSKTEVVPIENNAGTRQIQMHLPETSGSKTEVVPIENNIETSEIQMHLPETSGSKTEIAPTENASISPRLEDFLTEVSGSETATQSGISTDQSLNVQEGTGNDPEAKALDQWRLFQLHINTGNPDIPMNKAS